MRKRERNPASGYELGFTERVSNILGGVSEIALGKGG